MVGGGQRMPRPGEITLARSRDILWGTVASRASISCPGLGAYLPEALRQPMEDDTSAAPASWAAS
jgi:hypothetical protein